MTFYWNWNNCFIGSHYILPHQSAWYGQQREVLILVLSLLHEYQCKGLGKGIGKPLCWRWPGEEAFNRLLLMWECWGIVIPHQGGLCCGLSQMSEAFPFPATWNNYMLVNFPPWTFWNWAPDNKCKDVKDFCCWVMQVSCASFRLPREISCCMYDVLKCCAWESSSEVCSSSSVLPACTKLRLD